MELKEAYKKGLKDRIQPLVDAGKITLAGTIEDLVEDLAEAFFEGIKDGARLSDDKWDDPTVIPAADFVYSRVKPHIDKIDGKEG